MKEGNGDNGDNGYMVSTRQCTIISNHLRGLSVYIFVAPSPSPSPSHSLVPVYLFISVSSLAFPSPVVPAAPIGFSLRMRSRSASFCSMTSIIPQKYYPKVSRKSVPQNEVSMSKPYSSVNRISILVVPLVC